MFNSSMHSLSTEYIVNLIVLITSGSKVNVLNIVPLIMLQVLNASESELSNLIMKQQIALRELTVDFT